MTTTHLRQKAGPGLQVVALIAAWAACEWLSRTVRLPINGGVLGMGLLFCLLRLRIVDETMVERGSRWLLGEMLLFFMPAVVAVLDHPEFLGLTGLKILAVVLVGTITVMASTALTIEWLFRRQVAEGSPAPSAA